MDNSFFPKRNFQIQPDRKKLSWLTVLTLLSLVLLSSQACSSPVPLLSLTPTAEAILVTVQPEGIPTRSESPPLPVLPTETPSTAEEVRLRPVLDDYSFPRLQILAQWDTLWLENRYIWSPEGSFLLLVSDSASRLIDVNTFQQIWEIEGAQTAEFSEDGKQIQITRDGENQLYRASDGQADWSGEKFTPVLPPETLIPIQDIGLLSDEASPSDIISLDDDYIVVFDNGITQELLSVDGDSPECISSRFYGLPQEIVGYSLSPDHRLILVAGIEQTSPPVLRTVVIGLNNGFERALLSQPSSPPSFDFAPYRPGLSVEQRLPLLQVPRYGQVDFPALIPTLSAPIEDFTLRNWTRQDSLDQLQELIDFSTANDVVGLARSRWNYYFAQQPIRLSALEYLSRYPDTPEAPAVRWRLAMSDALSGRTGSDAWIADQLAQALNRDRIPLNELNLNAALIPFGFYVKVNAGPHISSSPLDCDAIKGEAPSQSATNIFGDRLPSYVITVYPIGFGTGMVVVAHQGADGLYRAVPVASDWDLSGDDQEIDVIDVTGDGRPEIRVDTFRSSGNIFEVQIEFYQWKGDVEKGEFVSLTGGIRNESIAPYQLLYQDAADGSKTIEFTRAGIGTFQEKNLWKWNGQRYEKSTRYPFPFTDLDPRSAQWLYLDALSVGQYDEVIEQIKASPEDPWSTLVLAFAESLQFHPEHAKTALLSLADRSKKDPTNALANAAQAYLDHYHTGSDLYTACLAALQVLDPEERVPCSPSLAFKRLLESLSETPTTDLPKTLESLGIMTPFHTSHDFDRDGKTDWLFSDYSMVWVALSRSDGIEILKSFPLKSDSSATFEWKILNLAYDYPETQESLFLIHSGTEVVVFNIQQSSGEWSINELLRASNSTGYQIIDDEENPSLVIFHTVSPYKAPEIARWDPVTGSFAVNDYIEYLLFTAHRTDEVIQIVPELLAELNALPEDNSGILARLYSGPRLQYMLGLAYEWAGDEAGALRTFYDLWKQYPITSFEDRGHPDQPYALMARRKLIFLEP